MITSTKQCCETAGSVVIIAAASNLAVLVTM